MPAKPRPRAEAPASGGAPNGAGAANGIWAGGEAEERLMKTVLAVGGEQRVPAPDAIARDYLLIALRLDQHVPGLVDGYFGPRDLKAQVDVEARRSPAQLAEDAAALRERVAIEVSEPDRARWLDRQLLALEAQAAVRAELELPFEELAHRCLDAAPEEIPAGAYPAVRAELERMLPGPGDLRERLAGWDARFVIPAGRLGAVVDWLLPRLREASCVHFPVPAGESLRVGLVSGQPWSGYNWYDGGLRSRIDLNIDLPIRPYDLIVTLGHETFPGHHLEHTRKEAHLVHELGRLEASVLLINTPECYVSEGLAELGRRYVLDHDAWRELLVGAYDRAGIAAGADEAERQIVIGEALHRLRGAGGDAALRLYVRGQPRDEVQRFLEEDALMSPDRAAKRLEFVEHPLWRTYVFSYAGGEGLLSAWCETTALGFEATPRGFETAGPGEPPIPAVDRLADARARFMRLLTEQLTPSAIAADLGAAG